MMYNNIFGIRSIIKLNKYFDYYNDILPLCIELKHMIKYNKKQNTLIIFSKCFDDRFYNKSIYKKIINSIKKNDSNILIWKDVLNYSLNYKHNNEVNKYSNDDLYHMNNRFIEIQNNYAELPDDISAEYKELFPIIEYYNMISNKDRFEKIKNLEKELIYIPLNNDEKEVLNIIKNHIKFKDNIEYIDNEIYMK